MVDILNSGVLAYTHLDTYRGFSSVFGIHGPLFTMYWGIQLGLMAVALVLTFFHKVRRSYWGASVTGLLVLVSVWAMRWNTVIGGQLQPKVSQGLVRYVLPMLGRDSVQTALGIAGIAVVLVGLQLLLLPWAEEWTRHWIRHARPLPETTKGHIVSEP